MTGHMNRVVETVLYVTVERWYEPIPQAALGEHQEAQTVELVHDLYDAGEE